MAFPKLSHVFDLVISGPPGFSTTSSKFSDLCVANVDRGTVTTADGKTQMRVVAGSDWMKINSESPTLSIDARVSAVDDDDVNLEFAYLGKMRVSPEVLALFSGESMETQFGEGYYYTTPRISSRSEKFAWVNDVVFISMGKLRLDESGRVEAWYRILKID